MLDIYYMKQKIEAGIIDKTKKNLNEYNYFMFSEFLHMFTFPYFNVNSSCLAA